MADLDLNIAGRIYRVACADGEEPSLTEAARLVAAEADTLREQFGPSRFATLPESRVLLMSGLMVADRFRASREGAPATTGQEDWLPEDDAPTGPPEGEAAFVEDAAARIAELEAELAASREAEAAALTALQEATGRVRTLAAELRGDDDEAA